MNHDDAAVTQAECRVVLWGTYDLSKPRTRLMRDALLAGVSVVDIHADVWSGVEDKSQVSGPMATFRAGLRWLLAYPRLIWRYLRTPRHDAVVVLYMGHLDILVLWPWARMRGVPIVWDVMLTMHDTLVEDRELVAGGGLGEAAVRLWDRLAFGAATRAVMLTRARLNATAARLGIADDRIRVVPLSAETAAFQPTPPKLPENPGCLRILFYAQFTPMHGLDRVIEAAQTLTGSAFHWRFIGMGQEGWRLREWIDRAAPDNVSWAEWVHYENLSEEIAEADVCLGVFGDSKKALTSAPNKVLQTLAAGRGLITRDTAAVREVVGDVPGPGVYLVAGGTTDGLIEALRQAWRDRDGLRQGPLHGEIMEALTPEATGRAFLDVIRGVTES